MQEPTQPGAALPPPASDDREAWGAYWAALGQPWRREPEIAAERQRRLAERRALPADPEHYKFPFAYVPLMRADVEWLLAAREDARSEERPALDLSSAILKGVDLSDLPLRGLVARYANFTELASLARTWRALHLPAPTSRMPTSMTPISTGPTCATSTLARPGSKGRIWKASPWKVGGMMTFRLPRCACSI